LTEKIERVRESAAAEKEYDISVKYASQMEERGRIAQKLHDELGHTLSGSTMQLEAIMLLAKNDPEKAMTMLKTVTQGLRAGTESIRRILKDMKPEAASISIGMVRKMAAETKGKSGIQTEVVYDAGVGVMTQSQWRCAAENIREALTNMMRHSGATRAVISFERLNKLMKISVSDNGRGCMHIKPGLGIGGMEERTQQIGGKLIIDGTHGFSMIMLLPLEENKE
jgi:signal transduction histidine kinase